MYECAFLNQPMGVGNGMLDIIEGHAHKYGTLRLELIV